jgi:beta-aspartyl-peptidase (threonine type)
MEYKGLTLDSAARLVVNEKLLKAGGSGGVIAIDRKGNISMPFNSEGMYRGYRTSEGASGVFIFADEPDRLTR